MPKDLMLKQNLLNYLIRRSDKVGAAGKDLAVEFRPRGWPNPRSRPIRSMTSASAG